MDDITIDILGERIVNALMRPRQENAVYSELYEESGQTESGGYARVKLWKLVVGTQVEARVIEWAANPGDPDYTDRFEGGKIVLDVFTTDAAAQRKAIAMYDDLLEQAQYEAEMAQEEKTELALIDPDPLDEIPF